MKIVAASLLALAVAAPASADRIVIFGDNLSVRGGRGPDLRWTELLPGHEVELVANPGLTAYKALHWLRYYPNRFDFEGRTVVFLLGTVDAMRGKPPFEWTAVMTLLVEKAFDLGAERVLLPLLPPTQDSTRWWISLFNQGLLSICKAFPSAGNPRARPMPVRCGPNLYTALQHLYEPINRSNRVWAPFYPSEEGQRVIAEEMLRVLD